MAVKRHVVETRISDLSGEEGSDVQRMRFSYDGKSYSLDVTPGEQATFEGAIASYIEAAKNKSGNVNENGDDTETIRQWAKDHGHDVSDRGRLSASVKAAFYAAQADPGNFVETNDSESPKTSAKKK